MCEIIWKNNLIFLQICYYNNSDDNESTSVYNITNNTLVDLDITSNISDKSYLDYNITPSSTPHLRHGYINIPSPSIITSPSSDLIQNITYQINSTPIKVPSPSSVTYSSSIPSSVVVLSPSNVPSSSSVHSPSQSIESRINDDKKVQPSSSSQDNTILLDNYDNLEYNISNSSDGSIPEKSPYKKNDDLYWLFTLLILPIIILGYHKLIIMKSKNKIMACPFITKKFKRRRRSKSAPNLPIQTVEVINPLTRSHSDSELNDIKL